jgi:hypothetical protein
MSGLSTSTGQPPVALDEIKRAWHALRAGEFALDASACQMGSRRRGRSRTEWEQAPGETTLAVVGCAGSVGASTIALAAALAAPTPVRVVECCSVTASGLAAASNAELGLHPTGWRRGKRDHVLLERPSEVMAGPGEVPVPTVGPHDGQLTILDVGWEVGQLLATKCWLTAATLTADRLVLVTSATVPGMRRLEGALDLLTAHGRAADIWIAVRGARRRKWQRVVERSAGPGVRRALAGDHSVEIPDDSDLAILGLDSREIPAPLISAAGQLLDLSPDPTADLAEVEREPASWTS